MDEYTAKLLDHRHALRRWADLAIALCREPKVTP